MIVQLKPYYTSQLANNDSVLDCSDQLVHREWEQFDFDKHAT